MRAQKFGPPRGDIPRCDWDRMRRSHKAHWYAYGPTTWDDFAKIYRPQKVRREKVEVPEWGEDPTFRRPIAEIIASINAKARK